MIEKFWPKTVKLLSISIHSIGESIRGFIRGKTRHANFLMAKREAIRRCQEENRKIYVIQESGIHWRVFSSMEVRNLKRTGVFKKSLTFLEMEEKAAFTARPELLNHR